MRPLYLEMNYFGPHEHSIVDFQKLDEAPIFLISGDTGAGKSTIFDAMTYALFNATTGEREAREMRSQFATLTQTTAVYFYFEENAKIYRVKRTPEQFQARKKGSGQTKRKATASLALVDEVGGLEKASLATKPGDVAAAITEILNLTADQFKKIVLLPQNDFSEFLKSKTVDKEKILKKIFGTQLFTQFTAKLKEHYQQAQTQAQAGVQELTAQLAAPVWTAAEQEQLQQTPREQLAHQLTTYLQEKKAAVQLATQKETRDQQIWQATDRAYQAGQAVQADFQKLEQTQTKYQKQISARQAEFQTWQQHLAELEWAQPLQKLVQDLDRKEKDIQKGKQQEQELTHKLRTAQEKLQAAQSEFLTLKAAEPEYEAQQQQAQKLLSLIPQVQDVERIQAQLKRIQPQLAQAQEQAQAQTAKLTTVQSKLAAKEQELADLADFQSQKEDLRQEQDHLLEVLTPLESARAKTQEKLAQVQDRLKKQQEQLQIQVELNRQAQKDYTTKIKTRQQLMIAQLQAELEPNQPCPVCGSPVHPLVQQGKEQSESVLRAAMAAVDESQKQAAASQSRVQALKEDAQSLTQDQEQGQVELRQTQAQLTQQYQQLQESSSEKLPLEFNLKLLKEHFQTAIQELDQQIKISQSLSEAIQDLKKEQDQIQVQVDQSQAQATRLETEIAARRQDLQTKKQASDLPAETSAVLQQREKSLTDAYQQFQKQYQKAQETVHENELQESKNQTKLTTIKEDLAQKKATVQKLTLDLQQALNDSEAKTRQQAELEQWLTEINQGQLKKLPAKIAEYQTTEKMLMNDLTQLQEKLATTTKPDLDQLQEKSKATQARWKVSLQEKGTVQQNFHEAQTSWQKIQKIMQEQAKFADSLAAVTSLYNVINGKDGNDDKLKLETYVVQNYLRQILEYANITFLNRLSNNRYVFNLASESNNHRRDHGLDISVYDRETNAVRSTDTLSGGETFIAALSIALSLSEVVQSSSNGVRVEALFIDEGFGSLDEETLDKAMVALQDIGQNRMVGVISHIDSMKQSIGQQLLVQKVGNGHSKIKLINK
ncbi:SMC family ATPase [Lactobacillus sp. DCY120]|uniref:Nuclease SbcCD subunit C n=1 Tax=Bombilactobacillus apium TaxID=2675299 RepID=A0A850RAH5_9LACO|nr:SMC family ATPase [Bombilactobacillus apium]NVY96356.1 SMC family ATPase [Bombilactobacillus apium]